MNSHFFHRMFWGLTLIVIGVLFLLNQTGRLDFDLKSLITTYWPVILIYAAASGLLFQSRTHGSWNASFLWNLILLLVGCYFLGLNLGVVHFGIGELIPYAIPVGLILFGVWMILKPQRKQQPPAYHHGPGPQGPQDWEKFDAPPPPPPPHYHSQHHENHSEWFGDTYIGRDSWELKPLNVSHFIGDTVIDLTRAYIPMGETRINISSFIGDVKIFVPNDPELEICTVSSSFIGDSTVLDQHESGFFKSVNFMTPGYEDGLKKIRVHVSVFIGDLRVQRVG